ncbi:hypothetical protein V6N11_083353 [Hibiscus sabdariffa]|uniref:DC1 domain-containing protein n=1 Tax=Hibiscus sabdariffa TaxID=183260 RepID=A0ABR2QLN3_9ROSI
MKSETGCVEFATKMLIRVVLEDNDESCKETRNASLTLITEVVEQTSIGEQMVAIEIKHEYHDHNLRLSFSGVTEDDGQCDGCMRPISTPFYGCDQSPCALEKPCLEVWEKQEEGVITIQYKQKPMPQYLYRGFAYRCASCDFDLHGNCSLLQVSVASNFPTCLNQHPLLFIPNYTAHVHCATNKAIWDGTIVSDGNDEMCKETHHASLNLITQVVEQTSIGEQMVAIEIKHDTMITI